MPRVEGCTFTRQLIELGGLAAKAGIVELTYDDRAAIGGSGASPAALAPTRQARIRSRTIGRRSLRLATMRSS